MSLSGVMMTIRSTDGSLAHSAPRRAKRVVGLPLDHRPDDDSECLQRLLRQRELGLEHRVDTRMPVL